MAGQLAPAPYASDSFWPENNIQHGTHFENMDDIKMATGVAEEPV